MVLGYPISAEDVRQTRDLALSPGPEAQEGVLTQTLRSCSENTVFIQVLL